MTTIMTNNAVLNTMKERKSVRKYKEGVEIPQQELLQLLEEATTAPSSSNMQPWRFLVIQDQEAKKQLRSVAYNQEQIGTSSAVIAVLGDLNMFEKTEQIYNATVEQGFMTREVGDMMIKNTYNLYANLAKEDLKNVIQYDAGLVSMQIMLLAKEKGYDTVTMGGYSKEKFAEMFNLPENEFPIVLISIGVADAPAYGTSRLPIEQVTRFI